MDCIKIKENKNADTRSATELVAEGELYDSSVQHIEDVASAMHYMSDRLFDIAGNHDFTKLEDLKQFHADFENAQKTKCDFTKLPWYQEHVKKERHHLDRHVPDDVNLFDVLERIADIVMAGMSRTGEVFPDELPSDVLVKAYKNTISLIKEKTVVMKEETPNAVSSDDSKNQETDEKMPLLPQEQKPATAE